MKSFGTFLIEAEVLQKDKILLFLSKHEDKDPRMKKLSSLLRNGKLSERQIKAISDSIQKGTFNKIEKIKQRSGEDRRKGSEERRGKGSDKRKLYDRRENERRKDQRRNRNNDRRKVNIDYPERRNNKIDFEITNRKMEKIENSTITKLLNGVLGSELHKIEMKYYDENGKVLWPRKKGPERREEPDSKWVRDDLGEDQIYWWKDFRRRRTQDKPPNSRDRFNRSDKRSWERDEMNKIVPYERRGHDDYSHRRNGNRKDRRLTFRGRTFPRREDRRKNNSLSRREGGERRIAGKRTDNKK